MSFRFPIRVYWEDTDAGGIVFYANYLKFFERARTEWLRSLGIGQQQLMNDVGGMFVVSRTDMRYLRPARLDDSLVVTAQLLEKGRSTLLLSQQALIAVAAAEMTVCEGTIRIGWVDKASLKPARIPAPLLEAIT